MVDTGADVSVIDTTFIKEHKITKRNFNYDKADMIEILKADAMKHYSDEDVELFIDNNISLYDNL